jgi:hypothetical protein
MPFRRIFQRIADDCAEWNFTCNKELLENQELVIVESPLWYVYNVYIYTHTHTDIIYIYTHTFIVCI